MRFPRILRSVFLHTLNFSLSTFILLARRMHHLFNSFFPLTFKFSQFCLNISGRGIYILYEDVKSCPYEDVHVLWSILVESHSSSLPLKK
ncbi:hypothetical protein AAZX31_01G223800 [Glycine max]